MIISFPAIFTSLLTVSVLIFILFLMLFINRYGLKIRYEYVLFICIVIVGRLVIPFEWNWTYTILSQEIMAPIYDFFHQSIYKNISLIDFFLITWGIGSVFFAIKYLTNMKKLYKLDRNFKNELEIYKKQFHFLENSQIKGIYTLKFISEPFVTNLFRPTIYLPDIFYTKQELEFILLHEAQHVKNKDLYTKLLFQILVIVYWWFPLIYILRNIVDYILELRVDYQVTQNFEEKVKNQYLLALVTVTQKIAEITPIKNYRALQNQFTLRKESLLKRRIIYFYNEPARKKYKYKLLIVIPSLFMILALPSVVFQPYTPYRPTKNEQTYSSNDLIQKMYLLKTKDGQYYLMDKKTNQKLASIKGIKEEPFNKMKLVKE